MKRKIIISSVCALMLLFAFAFSGCEPKFDNNDPRANVNIHVYDANMQPIKDAKLTLCTEKGESVKSDSIGVATFKNLKPGQHSAQIEKDGYASVITYFTIDMPNSTGDVAVAKTTAHAVKLSKLGAAVIGKAEYTTGSTTKALKDAEIRLTLGSYDSQSLINNLYTLKSGTDGSFKFENLPENVSYSITGANYIENGETYRVSNSLNGYTNYLYNEPIPLTNSLAYTQIINNEFMVTPSSTITLTAKNSSVVINFSLPVKTNLLTNSDIYTSNDELINKVWNNDKTRLTITPVSGEWQYTGFYVYLRNFYSINDFSLQTSSVYVRVELETFVSNVGTLILTADTNMHKQTSGGNRDILKVQWTAVEGATGYTVYYRDTKNSSYSSLSSGNITFDGNIVIANLSSRWYSSYFDNGDSIEIAVFAYNDNGGRSASAAKITISKI